MTVDLTCSNIVIAAYPPWAGGKFLLNCLGLSKEACLQSAFLTRLQLQGNLTSLDKFDYLMAKLDAERYQWTDLGLGCRAMFNNKWDPEYFYKTVKEVTHSNKIFFVVAHNQEEFSKQLAIWPNAQVIKFNNAEQFIKWRRGEYYNDQWLVYGKEIDNVFNTLNRPVFEWNTCGVFNQTEFIKQITSAYNHFQLPDLNLKLVTDFCTKYIDKLELIKNWGQYEVAL
jgi:hypothetical protein